jgi:hypothetical protein
MLGSLKKEIYNGKDLQKIYKKNMFAFADYV